MLSLKLVVVVAAAVVAGVGGVVNAIWGPRARAARRLARAPRTFIEGEVVTLVGKVRSRTDTLVAPLSGRPCVAFEAHACLYRGRERGESFAERGTTAFELDTRDGVVTVESSDDEALTFALVPIPIIPRRLEREQAFLEARGRSGLEASTAGFEEIVVEPGDEIAVQGVATVEHPADEPGERGYRDAAKRIRLVAHPQHPLTIGKP